MLVNAMKLLQKCKIFYIYDGLLKFGLSCTCPSLSICRKSIFSSCDIDKVIHKIECKNMLGYVLISGQIFNAKYRKMLHVFFYYRILQSILTRSYIKGKARSCWDKFQIVVIS